MKESKRKQRKWANKKIKNAGINLCSNCNTDGVECISINFNWFATRLICEGCIQNCFRKLRSDL